MQKLLKKLYLLTVLILTVCLAASCTMLSGFKKLSETGHASINGKKVNLKTMGDPEKDCLAFGYLKIPTEQLYIQSDPSKEPIYTTPFVFQGAYADGSIFCFPPFKTDLAFQLASLRNVNFNVITTFSPQLGAEGKIAFVTHKKGLMFIGAYDFITEGKAGMIVPLARKDSAQYELKCLLKIKKLLQHTAWLPLIEARIKELENEKK